MFLFNLTKPILCNRYRRAVIIVMGFFIGMSLAACGMDKEMNADQAPLISNPGTETNVESQNTDIESDDELRIERELYEQCMDILDTGISGIRSRERDCAFYRELVSSDYVFSDCLSGWLQAECDEQGVFQIDLLMSVYQGDSDQEEFQRYRLYLLGDGSLYFTCQTQGKTLEEDIPAYAVCEDALRYSRLDYMYGEDYYDDWEERKRQREVDWQENFDRQLKEGEQEYWYREGILYAVDRQEGTLTDATADKVFCIAAFLQLQPERIAMQLNMDESKAAQVEKLLPKGYCFMDDWVDYAACDLNHDGMMDYVVALYPEDYPEEQRYVGFSPYEHMSWYYAAQFWLFLSDGEQDYQRIPLSDSVEYQDDALTLVDISFEKEGLLRLEYFIGRSPWYTATLLFEYEEPKENAYTEYFYIVRSYRHDDIHDGEQIGTAENYGHLGIRSYFSRPFYFQESAGGTIGSGSERGVSLSESTFLTYYSGSCYTSHNTWEEQLINSRIWTREFDMLEAVQNTFAGGYFSLYEDPVFWNDRIVSHVVRLTVGERTVGTMIPIMVDRKSGEYINVTERISKEEFLELFEEHAHLYSQYDMMKQSKMTVEERNNVLSLLTRNWDRADSLEGLTAFDGQEICLQIAQGGVLIGVRGDSDYRLEYYQIDKEHFMSTELWYYLEPEWMHRNE